MSTRFFNNSEDAWTAMLHSINTATTSIYWEAYIFQNDTIATHDFVSALEKKAQEGIDIVLVADGFGSYYFDKESLKRLKEAGAEVLFYKHPLWRTHRKILVIDNAIVFFGGVNISNQHRKWADLHVATTSKTTIKGLMITFARFYAVCGGKNTNILRHSEGARKKAQRASQEVEVQELIIEHLPNLGQKRLRPVYERLLNGAKRKVVFVTPYFVPARWMITLIKELLARDVIIEIVIPKHTNPGYIDAAHRVIAKELVPKGVRFYLTENMIHAKAFVIDDEMGLVGSQNVDPVSFGLTMETGVFFRDKESLKKLDHIIKKWMAGASPFSPELIQSHWYDPLISLLMKVVATLLG
ncbi:MAG: phosphatidylserine/phosphatidylglycerophosphate/cardiolipin synthase family protein [bacterium]|nr:phosphatidylserine/phosphatidylglycerophosphate/cardiolipin synthase family protein [bacterium]